MDCECQAAAAGSYDSRYQGDHTQGTAPAAEDWAVCLSLMREITQKKNNAN